MPSGADMRSELNDMHFRSWHLIRLTLPASMQDQTMTEPFAQQATDGGYCHKANFMRPQGVSSKLCLETIVQPLRQRSCFSHHYFSTAQPVSALAPGPDRDRNSWLLLCLTASVSTRSACS